MRLVDRDEARPGRTDGVEHLVVGELLGREEEELELARRGGLERGAALGRGHGRAHGGGARVVVAQLEQERTWSCWSAMSGETTSVGPGSSRPGSW